MTILLIIIYLAFISLGLPDSVLGVTIPALQGEWGISLSQGSYISMLVVGGTIVSSFASGRVIGRWGTGRTTLISCLMTGGALLGFSLAPSYLWLLFWAIPLGLGGGSVDAALNNFVALHYKARHMNWLHSFWGVGATLGPVIMSLSLASAGWQSGYRHISFIQLSLAVILLLSLGLWKGRDVRIINEDSKQRKDTADIRRIPGVLPALLSMTLYCSAEAAVGLWGSSYLVGSVGFSVESAAFWLSFYYGGITAGRFVSGFLTLLFDNVKLIRYGIFCVIGGVVLLILSSGGITAGLSFVLIGFGLSPVFPSMLHETPVRFGKEHSQRIVGYQMGFAYIGSAFVAPLLGVIMEHSSLSAFPFALLGVIVLLLVSTENLNIKISDKNRNQPLAEDF